MQEQTEPPTERQKEEIRIRLENIEFWKMDDEKLFSKFAEGCDMYAPE